MAIRWRLAVMMAEREMANKELAQLIDKHPTTISRLRTHCPLKLDIETLTALCKALKCQPGDLLVYEEEKDPS
ncbi:MAG: helix-turn-helix transcriptional regulator [Cyanobacteriota bacterium]|nr:helix-turn-helix transcriptional regulator [Cyanobacteriota bacterium]